MIFNREYECMPLEDLRRLQEERLRELVARVYARVPHYKKVLDEAGVKPEDVRTLDDLRRLPFTTKDDLRANYPFGMFAVPLSEVVEIHASSGTTGKPTVVGYTKNDLKLWGEVMARTLCCAGATPADTIHNAYGYGLFTGGLGVHYGALTLGARVVPVSSGVTKRQLLLMQDFEPTVLTCTPSYALYMAEEAREMGIDVRKFKLRVGLFGAEPWSEGMRQEIERVWDLSATDIYGLSEIIGPGVAQECPAKDGLHIFADVFLPEVIDPDTGEPVPEGGDGELVITTLTKEALPLIRYRTRDIVSMTTEPCSRCGRTLPRMSKVKGRTDDMLIIRGVNVFPSQIEEVLLSVEGALPHYQIVVERTGQLDTLTVEVEVDESVFSDEIRDLERLARRIQDEIVGVLGIQVDVRLVEPKTIERSMGKAKRVIDKRKI